MIDGRFHPNCLEDFSFPDLSFESVCSEGGTFDSLPRGLTAAIPSLFWSNQYAYPSSLPPKNNLPSFIRQPT